MIVLSEEDWLLSLEEVILISFVYKELKGKFFLLLRFVLYGVVIILIGFLSLLLVCLEGF